jgi:hypothetical protein
MKPKELDIDASPALLAALRQISLDESQSALRIKRVFEGGSDNERELSNITLCSNVDKGNLGVVETLLSLKINPDFFFTR